MKAQIGQGQGNRRPSRRTAIVLVMTVALLMLFDDSIYRVKDALSDMWNSGISSPIELVLLLMLLPVAPFLLLSIAFCIPFGDPAPLEYQAVQIQNVSTVPVTFINGDDNLVKKRSIRTSALCGNRTVHLQPGMTTSIKWGYAVKSQGPNQQKLPLYAIAVDRLDRVVFGETYTYDQLEAANWIVTINARKITHTGQSLADNSSNAVSSLVEARLVPCGRY